MPLGAPDVVDVFLSYAREDRANAEALVRLFERQGWSVWWDRDLTPGGPYRREIRERLETARCVVVLWSSHSIESSFVADEASAAERRGVLVPALLEDVTAPLGFGEIQAAPLTHGPSQEELAQLLRGVGRILGRDPIVPPHDGVKWKRWAAISALASPLPLAVAFLSMVPLQDVELAAHLRTSGVGFTLHADEALLTGPAALESLGTSGLREFRVTPTPPYDQPIVLLSAQQAERRGTINLDVPLLRAGTRVTLDSAGSFAGSPRGYRVRLEGSVPALGISLNGPIQIDMPGNDPVTVTREANHDRAIAQPDSGVRVDLDLFLTAGAAPALPPWDSVGDLSFTRLVKFREGERRVDLPLSTIVSGTVSFPSLGRDAQALTSGDELTFSRSLGRLDVKELSGGQFALTFAGSVAGLRAKGIDVPSYLEWLASRHAGPLVVAVGPYAIAAGVVAFRWKRRLR